MIRIPGGPFRPGGRPPDGRETPVEIARRVNPDHPIGYCAFFRDDELEPDEREEHARPAKEPADADTGRNDSSPVASPSRRKVSSPAVSPSQSKFRRFIRAILGRTANRVGISLFLSAGAIAANGGAPFLSVSATLASGAGLAGFGALPSGSFNLASQLCHGICNLFPMTGYPIF